jgi:hypothetical protein
MNSGSTCALFLQPGMVGYKNKSLWDNITEPLVVSNTNNRRFTWTDLGATQRLFCIRNATTMPSLSTASTLDPVHVKVLAIYTFIKDAQRKYRGTLGGDTGDVLLIRVPDSICKVAASSLIMAALTVYLDKQSGLEPDNVICPTFVLDPMGFTCITDAFLPLDITNPGIGSVNFNQLDAVFRFHATQFSLSSASSPHLLWGKTGVTLPADITDMIEKIFVNRSWVTLTNGDWDHQAATADKYTHDKIIVSQIDWMKIWPQMDVVWGLTKQNFQRDNFIDKLKKTDLGKTLREYRTKWSDMMKFVNPPTPPSHQWNKSGTILANEVVEMIHTIFLNKDWRNLKEDNWDTQTRVATEYDRLGAKNINWAEIWPASNAIWALRPIVSSLDMDKEFEKSKLVQILSTYREHWNNRQIVVNTPPPATFPLHSGWGKHGHVLNPVVLNIIDKVLLNKNWKTLNANDWTEYREAAKGYNNENAHIDWAQIVPISFDIWHFPEPGDTPNAGDTLNELVDHLERIPLSNILDIYYDRWDGHGIIMLVLDSIILRDIDRIVGIRDQYTATMHTDNPKFWSAELNRIKSAYETMLDISELIDQQLKQLSVDKSYSYFAWKILVDTIVNTLGKRTSETDITRLIYGVLLNENWQSMSQDDWDTYLWTAQTHDHELIDWETLLPRIIPIWYLPVPLSNAEKNNQAGRFKNQMLSVNMKMFHAIWKASLKINNVIDLFLRKNGAAARAANKEYTEEEHISASKFWIPLLEKIQRGFPTNQTINDKITKQLRDITQSKVYNYYQWLDLLSIL